jgi:hypothetical protein
MPKENPLGSAGRDRIPPKTSGLSIQDRREWGGGGEEKGKGGEVQRGMRREELRVRRHTNQGTILAFARRAETGIKEVTRGTQQTGPEA